MPIYIEFIDKQKIFSNGTIFLPAQIIVMPEADFFKLSRKSNVHELARAIGKDDAYVSRIIRFTLLAPDIIHAVLAGKINKSISTEKLKQSLPPMWEDQKKMFDIE